MLAAAHLPGGGRAAAPVIPSEPPCPGQPSEPCSGEQWCGGGRCLLPVQGGGEGRCHFTSPNPPAFSLIKPVLLISGNERNLEVKLSSYAR